MNQLRERVLSSLLIWIATGCSIALLVTLTQVFRNGSLNATMIGLFVLVASLWVFVPTVGRVSYRASVLLFLAQILVASTYLQTFHGLTAGTALFDAAFLLLAGLFFGFRGILVAFAALLISLVLSATIALNGLVVPWSEALWDPGEPFVWVRYLCVLLFLVGGLAVAYTYLFDSLSDSHAKLEQALDRERFERSQREKAQREIERSRRLEALAQLAAGFAHDFNNGLGATLALAHRIKVASNGNPQVAELAKSIMDGVDASARTVKDLMSLGRREQSAIEDVALRPLLKRIEVVLRNIFPETVRVRVTLDGADRVRVDPGRLHQALLNIALNARDALPQGGSFSISVRTEQPPSTPATDSPSTRRYVVFTCTDDGVGMEDDVLDRLFEPFFTTKSAAGGTGLGLAMVRSAIVEAGGFVDVASQPGQGTTLRLYLPEPSDDALALAQPW